MGKRRNPRPCKAVWGNRFEPSFPGPDFPGKERPSEIGWLDPTCSQENPWSPRTEQLLSIWPPLVPHFGEWKPSSWRFRLGCSKQVGSPGQPVLRGCVQTTLNGWALGRDEESSAIFAVIYRIVIGWHFYWSSDHRKAENTFKLLISRHKLLISRHLG